MTHDPRLPTLEEVMTGSPFDIIDTPWGHIERWRASTLATGTMGALANVYAMVRSDAAASQARADADQARTALIRDLCTKVDAAHTRLDNLVAELAAEREARRADAARQAKLDEEEIELPPDLQDFQAQEPPRKIEDGDDTHQPGGELHSVEPKEEPELEDPDLELEDSDNIGDLPPELVENQTRLRNPRANTFHRQQPSLAIEE